MDLDDPTTPEVVAMRFDADSVAADLASWCGGHVSTVDGAVVISVPTDKGTSLARHDDWIVRLGDDRYAVMGPAEFAARAQPLRTSDGS